MILSLFLIILAYLMGSVCSAVIVSKSCSLPDPRTSGSKNPGATNVLRLAGKKYAIMVLVTDLLKGTIPVLIAKMFDASPETVAFTALAAVIGHMYPVFFDFKGGKGVATAIGALLGFQFVVGILVAGTWLIIAKLFRYSSLASLVALGLAPFYSLLIIGRMDIFLPIFFMAVLVVVKHKANISRLMDGTESKVTFKQESILEEVMDEDEDSVLEQNIDNTAVPVPKKSVSKAATPKTPKSTAAKSAKSTTAKTTKAAPKKAAKTESTEKKAKPVKKAAAKPKAKSTSASAKKE